MTVSLARDTQANYVAREEPWCRQTVAVAKRESLLRQSCEQDSSPAPKQALQSRVVPPERRPNPAADGGSRETLKRGQARWRFLRL